MALTAFQRDICRLIAQNRIASGESYVAGGSALNELLAGSRLSRDVDLFHDTEAALDFSWRADRSLLEANGFQVRSVRERSSFVEAEVALNGESVLLQWVRDSAYRFFPLVEHPVFGLTLHPFDLATNKVLALVGRLEVRDWIDVIQCDDACSRLGSWRGRPAERIQDSVRPRSWSRLPKAVAIRSTKSRHCPSRARVQMRETCHGAGMPLSRRHPKQSLVFRRPRRDAAF